MILAPNIFAAGSIRPKRKSGKVVRPEPTPKVTKSEETADEQLTLARCDKVVIFIFGVLRRGVGRGVADGGDGVADQGRKRGDG